MSQPEQTMTAKAASPVSPAVFAEAAAPVTEAGEKPARRRATRAKKAAEDKAVPAVTPAPATPAAAPEAGKAQEKPAKKPARRRTRAKAEDATPAPAAEGAAAAEKSAAPAAEGTASVSAAVAKKASRARVAEGDQGVQDTPKPRRGRPRKKVEPAAEAPASTPAPEQAPIAAPAGVSASAAAAAPAQASGPASPEAPAVSGVPAAEVAAAASAASAPAAAFAPEAVANASAPATASPEAPAEERPREAREARPRPERQRKGDRNDRDSRNDRDNRSDRNNRNNKQGGKQGNRNDRNSRDDRNDRDNSHRRQRRQHDNRANREIVPSVNKEELAALKVAELRAKAAELGLDATGLKKADLVEAVYTASVKAEGFIEVAGVLDILADGYGFLRTSGYLPGEGDAYVGTSTIRRNGLRKGDLVVGQTRPARENEKFAAIQKVISVNGVAVDELGNRPRFADLTPIYPDDCLVLEHGKNTVSGRIIDLVSPIGKGQRGLIVSPPKAGKTTVLKEIAASISANNPEVHLMCLLVDERPEEVTDMQRSIKGEVISSTFDMPTENHIQVAELVIERAKRLVEGGRDVVILLDSLTRLARAYNLAQPASGRILSGGVDSTALYPPKKFLGAARNIEGGGSLTILASALVETGSKMDEVIFEEFKGTGNMELKLDRNLADRRIFPAIDPISSGTRKEELLLDPQEAPLIWAVRRILSNMNNTERAMNMLIKSLKQTDTNQEFLIRTAKKAQTQHGKEDGFGF